MKKALINSIAVPLPAVILPDIGMAAGFAQHIKNYDDAKGECLRHVVRLYYHERDYCG